MKIDELAQIDFNDHWIIHTRYGEVQSAPKDPHWLRWIKTVFQVLTFYFYDIYGHVRIDHVAQGIFKKFLIDVQENGHCTDHYIVVINRLLSTERPIRTHREELIRVKNRILDFEKNHQL